MTRNTSTQRITKPDYIKADNGVDGPTLIGLLTEQRRLYEQLKDLSCRQSEYIAQSDTQQLLSVLAARQDVVDQLTQLNEKIGYQPEQLAEMAADLPDDQRDGIRRLFDEIQAILEQIIRQDDDDRKQLTAASQKTGQQLKQVNQTGTAIHAYKSAPSSDAARFTDRKG